MNVIGVVPVHVPVVAVSVEPWVAKPEIVGSAEFTGTPEPPDEVTTAVALELALVEPLEFVAVTLTRRVEPTSPLSTSRVVPVSPEIEAQFDPPALQRCH